MNTQNTLSRKELINQKRDFYKNLEEVSIHELKEGKTYICDNLPEVEKTLTGYECTVVFIDSINEGDNYHYVGESEKYEFINFIDIIPLEGGVKGMKWVAVRSPIEGDSEDSYRFFKISENEYPEYFI